MGWCILAWYKDGGHEALPQGKQAEHLCRCPQWDQDAAGSTASLVIVISIAGIHKFKIR